MEVIPSYVCVENNCPRAKSEPVLPRGVSVGTREWCEQTHRLYHGLVSRADIVREIEAAVPEVNRKMRLFAVQRGHGGLNFEKTYR